MRPPIKVEDCFNSFVRKFGGQVVTDFLGVSPDHKNADYYFEREGIIAELKCFEDDKREDQLLQQKIQALFDQWIDAGKIPPVYGDRVTIQSKTLPVELQKAMSEIYKVPIQRRVIKANKQIKATAERLRLKSYRGLLLLANDGNYALEADMVLYLVWRILGSQFRNITDVVYFTVNMFATSPRTNKPCLVWARASRKHLDGISTQFTTELGSAWIRHFEAEVGEPVEEVHLDGFEALSSIRYPNG